MKSRDAATDSVVVSLFFFTPKSVAEAKELARLEAEFENRERDHRQQRVLDLVDGRLKQLDAAHRAQLKVGDYTSWDGTVSRTRINGLLVELKPPLAYMQFPELRPSSTMWVRIDELGVPRN